MLVIPAIRRQAGSEFKVSLGYIARLCSQQQKKQKNYKQKNPKQTEKEQRIRTANKNIEQV
jgi:hypothetical protein